MKPNVLTVLQKAIDGLVYPSKTSTPFWVFHWPTETGPIDSARILNLRSLPPNTPVEAKTVEEFFAGLTKEEDFHNLAEKAKVRKYRKLRDVITRGLSETQVLRAGKGNVEILIVGRTSDGSLGGVRTSSLEP